jgi:hypothetical protein
MIRKMARRNGPIVFCEMCGGTLLSDASDFIVFHHLTLCSPDCRDEYRAADEERRARKDAAVTPARPRKTVRGA